MNTFSLNSNWTVDYFEPNIDGFEMAPSAQPIAHLADWTCSARFAEAGFYAWLQRRFDLMPTDDCVRYLVQIENMPPSTKVYVNDQHIADADDTTLRLDVTDRVALGTNRLSLRVACAADAEHRFDSVLLLQVPCDAV
jgi:hypothetical protein